MTKLKLPLYARIVLGFLVNLGVVLCIGLCFALVTFKPGLEWLLDGPPGSRIELLTSYLRDDLDNHPQAEWNDVLHDFHAQSGVKFALFTSDGRQVCGEPLPVPDEVRKHLIDKRQPQGRSHPPRREAAPGDKVQPPKPRFLMRSSAPVQYWSGMHLDILFEEGGLWLPLTMVMRAEDVTANGLLFEWWPWLTAALLCILASALIWLPVVSGITRAILRLNQASKCIASGQFETRVPEQRNDELGELATSVNAMAAQLGDYVARQRRITADVAHELCSPIARMQMALGVVEQRATPDQAGCLRKLDAELQHMARLVEELLVFSKAETLPQHETAQTFSVRGLVNEVIAREAPEIELKCDVEDAELHTFRNAVDRALGNVLRNAVRYAREIEITGHEDGSGYALQVLDRGPGVPEASLEKLFDPFYRPDSSRNRSAGGSGLGLAIATRCLAACNGQIKAANREGGGLVVSLVLIAALHNPDKLAPAS